MKPNVLLVVLDAVRRDALEPYAPPSAATPAIAQLAQRGTAVEHAYSTASWTLPSHASMFTGLLPRELGLTQAPDKSPYSARPFLEAQSHRLLPEVLRGAGYATHGYSANLWASQHVGLDLGFDTFAYNAGDRTERVEGLTSGGRRALWAWAAEGMRARGDDGTADIGRALRRSIAEWNGQPTFFFVNLCESHSPYLPPRPWNDLPSWERARAALDSHRYLSFEAICRYVGGALTVPDEALDRMRHLYRRAASYMDEWLAGVLEALDRKGILDDTLVIVTSDHGENFGEGGLLVHGFSVDQRLIHVPLVMAGPGAADPGRVFSLRELSRLIAEAADLESHPWDEDGDGPAVAEYDPLGEPDDPAWDEFCSRWSIDHAGRERLGSRYSCATDGRLKLVLRNDAELLYDIVDDPQETTPLDIDEADDAVPTLRDAAARSHATTGPAVSPSPAATPATASPEELEQLERQMKLLGYM